MTTIDLVTQIQAPITLCFDLARDVDFHQESTGHTNEQAIGGVTTGLLELNNEVTWRARHFGFYFELTVRITEFEAQHYFCDEMVRGPFLCLRHEHHFSEIEKTTRMQDIFSFQSPLGIAGKIVDFLILKNHLTSLLGHRNRLLKQRAEEFFKKS